MITVAQANPGIPDDIHCMTAELLAVYCPDLHKRQQRRRDKLATFPESCQPAIREAANRTIKARNESRYKASNRRTA